MLFLGFFSGSLKYSYTSKKNTSQKIIWQNNISQNVLFPELVFVRNHIYCLNYQLLEIIPARMNTYKNSDFAKNLFSRSYIIQN